MVQITLFLVRLLKIPIEWLGGDFVQVEILLRTKLTLDFRNAPSAFQTSGRKKQTLMTQFFFYAIYGLLLAAVVYSLNDLLLGLSIFFSVMVVLLAMTIISEFTTVIFDTRDNYILLPRPVNNRTLLLSRLLHIQFYMGYIALALSLFTAVVVAIKFHAIPLLLFLLSVGLSTWLTLIFTTFVYFMISKVVEGEKFKDIVTYAQVIMGILIFAGYQLLPRIMDANLLNNAVMKIHWWTYLFPPSWLAALVKAGEYHGITTQVLLLGSLAVILPVSGAVLLIRFMSKGFENILGEASVESTAQVSKNSARGSVITSLRNFFCVSETEMGGWNLAVATTKRDRKFKQSVYPYFGIMFVFAIVILKPDINDLWASLHAMNGFNKFFFITIIGFAGSTAVSQLPYTDTPEAAWIYTALPLQEHSHILSGAVKSMLVRFFLPVYAFISVPALLLWGLKTLPQIMLGGFGIVVLIVLPLLLQKPELPFTQVREMQRKGTNSLIAIFSMILVAVLAGVLYFTSHLPPWVSYLFSVFTLLLVILFFRMLRKRRFVPVISYS
jgi:ABC-2 type transport system permease protein